MGTPRNILDVLGAIVGVTLVTTLVSHPETASVISALGSAFQGSLRASLGH